MKRKIVIKIDAGPKTCMKCEWLCPILRWCSLFMRPVKRRPPLRCPECLDAEKKGEKP